MRRRALLASVPGALAGLAGCSESESDASGSGATPSASEEETEGTSADSSGTAEAEATLRRYLEALAGDDPETVEELTHPESPAGTETRPAELTIDGISAVTLSTIADEADIEVSDDEIDAAEAAIGEVTTDIGAESYATVRYDVETQEYGAETGYALLVQDGGEWFFYEFRVMGYLYDAIEPDSTEEGTDEVTNRLQEVSSVGTDITDSTIGRVEIVVKKAPGAGDIDLSTTTVQFVHASGSTDLTFGAVGGNGSATEFGVQSIQDEGERSLVGDSPTLDDPADRAAVVLDTSVGAVTDGSLGEGDTATVRLTTASGGATEIRLVVPETISGDAVAL